jgi:hypothetical protein
MAERGWYYRLQGRPPNGPVSLRALRELARIGRLRPTDTMSRDGETNWIRAGNVKGLFGEPCASEPASSRVRPEPPELDRGPADVYIGPGIPEELHKK